MTSPNGIYRLTAMNVMEAAVVSSILSGVFWHTAAETARIGGSVDPANSVATAILLTATLLYVELR